KQFYVSVDEDYDKTNCVIDIYRALTLTQTVLFANTQKRCMAIANALYDEGFPVKYIHAGMSPEERQKTLREFKEGSARILVATNILSRGIDIQQIKLVINYD